MRNALRRRAIQPLRRREADYAQARHLHQSTLKALGRRLLWFGLGAAALVLAAALALRHYTHPAQVAQLARDLARTQLGLALDFDGAPRLQLWPAPRLQLQRASLGVPGGAPLLAAASVDLVLPWSTLRGDVLRLERLELEQPRLDLDALGAWLDATPPSGVPNLRLGLRLHGGSVLRAGRAVAEGIDLAGDLDLLAWQRWWRGLGSADSVDALLPPGALRLDAARVELGDTRLLGVHLGAEAP